MQAKSLAGMTVTPRLCVKCSTTASCATAARETHSRSLRRGSSSAIPYCDNGTSAAITHSALATLCASAAPAPGTPPGTRVIGGFRAARTTQYK